MSTSRIPVYGDILDAADQLKGFAVRTPLLQFEPLNAAVGGRIFIKPENLQRTGSFKFRGAYNAISRLTPEQRAHGVVAFSSGNHAQGVAAAAALCGVSAVIVMPRDAPRIKLDGARSYGAMLHLYDRYTESRDAVAEELVRSTGRVLIPPYDHTHIIAGQGTVGLEIADDLEGMDITPDLALVCCAGGGLTGGTALALKQRFPDMAVHPVEPEGFDDTARSLLAGERLDVTPGARSICDALLGRLGELTFALNRTQLSEGLVVSDEEVMQAMRFAFLNMKLVVEPGGSVALAAALSGKTDLRDKTAVVVLSGGNVDPQLYAAILGGHSSKEG